MKPKLMVGILAACVCAVPLAATQLKTAAQDNAPKFIRNGSAAMGIAVDVMRAIERLDPELKFVGDQQFLSVTRIELGLSDENKTGAEHLDISSPGKRGMGPEPIESP